MSTEPGPDPLAQMTEQLRSAMPGIPDRDIPRFIAAITQPGPYAPCPESIARDGVPRGTVTFTGISAPRRIPASAATSACTCRIITSSKGRLR